MEDSTGSAVMLIKESAVPKYRSELSNRVETEQRNPRPNIITDAVLHEARARQDVEIFDYRTFTAEFESEPPMGPPHLPFSAPRDKIFSNALDLIGDTPMIRLDRIAAKFGLECELVAKLEFTNIGGSVKDRIAKQMVEEAEAEGRLKPGDSIVEATSGNTGVGMCIAAALKGYNMMITLPDKMSHEKLNMMKALGAEIIRTPTEAPWHSLESHIGLANQLRATLPNCHSLDQYLNPGNPRAHYFYTGPEIIHQTDGKIDMICIGAGTGGTLTGVAARIKKDLPSCHVVGIDPVGSSLAVPGSLNTPGEGESYAVEGIGYDFIPSTLNRKFVDSWVKVDDFESFFFARELIRLECLLVGGSSGSAIAGAIKAAKCLKKGQRCVVILPDSSRNYMSKFVSDEWMRENGLAPFPRRNTPFSKLTVGDLLEFLDRAAPARCPSEGPAAHRSFVVQSCSMSQTLEAMRRSGQQTIAVVDGEAKQTLIGTVSEAAILSRLVTWSSSVANSSPPRLESVVNSKVRAISVSENLDVAAQLLQSSETGSSTSTFVPAVDGAKRFVGAVTRAALLRYLEAKILVSP